MKEASKQKLLLVAIALSAAPFILATKLPGLWTGKSIALYGSALTGFVGVILLLWEYILGTRSVMGLILNDLAWALRIHKVLGIYGTLLIFLHPILVIYSYGENLLYIFTPHLSSTFEKSASWGRLAFAIILITWVTSAVIRGRIAYRPWKYIHYLSYVALPAVVLHAPRIGSTLGNSHAALVYWYAVVSMFLIFAALRLRHVFGFGKKSFGVIDNKLIGEDMWLMRLKSIDARIKVSPGQYAYVQPSLLSEEHPFSLVDFNNSSGDIAFAYKNVGGFTRKLTKLKPGSSVLVDGPYGNFTTEFETDLNNSAIFIAGGIGVTPFIKHLLNVGKKDVTFFYCNRTRTSGIFRNYLKNTLGNRYIDVFSEDDNSASESNVEAGYLSANIVKKYVRDPLMFNYFVCGPVGMMDHCRAVLYDIGVSEKQIHTEEFGF